MKILSKPFSSGYSSRAIFFLFLLSYFILLTFLTFNVNLSEDETYTLNTTSGNFSRVITQSYNFEGQPPGYFILLRFWRYINYSVFFAKLFSVFITGLSLYFLYKLLSLIVPRKSHNWILVIFSLNPFTIWAALELRTYALLIFLSLATTTSIYKYVLERKNTHLYAFLLLSVVGIYTQYFFIFLLVALLSVLAILKKWKELWKTCLYLLPVGCIFLPNFFFLQDQIALHKISSSKSNLLDSSISVLYASQNFLLAINLVPDTIMNRAIRLLYFIFIFYTLFNFQKTRKQLAFPLLKKYGIILFVITFLIIEFILSIIVANFIFDMKYMSVAFPFFVLTFIIFYLYDTKTKNMIFFIISAYFTLLAFDRYKHSVKTYDYKSVAKYIESIESPGEAILIYRPALALPFSYYYLGKNRIFPLPSAVNFDSSYLINIKDTFQLKESLRDANYQSSSFLMISDTTIREGHLNMNRKMITDFIYAKYEVTLDTLFFGKSKDQPLRIQAFRNK